MANLIAKDGDGNSKYVKSTGTGTNGDPFIVDHSISTIASGTNTIGLIGIDSGSANINVASIASGTNIIGLVGIDSGSANVNITSGSVAANISSIAAGETHVGEVGSYIKTVSTEITNSSGSAGYLAGDVISGGSAVVTPYELPDLFRANGVGAFLTRISVMTNVSSQTERIRARFYNDATATVAADNLPDKEIYTEASKILGSYDLPAMVSSADTSGSCSRSFDTMCIPIVPAINSKSLFFSLSTLDACSSAATQKYILEVRVAE